MIATALLLTLPLALPLRATQGGPGEQAIPPIQEVGSEYILNFPQSPDGQSGMSLAQFVQACQQVTGLTFHVKEDAASRLSTSFVRLLGPKRIPKDKFYSFFQILMVVNDFVCTEIGPAGISVIQIDSIAPGNAAGGAKVRQAAPYVPPEDLHLYADQPATLITTVVNLPNTDVRSLSNTLRSLISDPNTQQMIPAGNSNSFVLTGFGTQVAALARMLIIIDEASVIDLPEPEFRLIRLEYAAADEIATIVEELLDFNSQFASRAAAAQPQGPTAPLARSQGQVKIIVDPRQNSLAVLALPEEMPRIRDLVAQLDVDTVDSERAYHIYAVENVKSADLAETLNSFLSDASRLETQPGSPQNSNAAGRGNNNSEFVVVPDEKSNSLLIAASRTRYQEVLDLIRRLDQRQPQVLIETALIELTGQDIYDLGIELALADFTGSPSSGGWGVTNFGLSTLSDTNGDGIMDLRVPNAGTGFTAGFLDGEDFSLPVLLAALEENRNSNVLNVPSVL
ncbi:MAG: secretin N-terminal domain-containing protein, partial [Planctomycetota bacterium]